MDNLLTNKRNESLYLNIFIQLKYIWSSESSIEVRNLNLVLKLYEYIR